MKQINRDGVVVRECDPQERPLHRLYGNAFGRFLLKPLTCRPISKLAGWFLNRRVSKVFIKSFVRNHNIDLSQFEPVKYKSYNAFFSRQIRPELRPIDPDPRHLISPCDCKLSALPITQDRRFTLKHTQYTVASLLDDRKLAREYEGGWALIFRLTVDDYHRYCYVADGEKGENIRIPGKFHTVNPIANDYFPIYKENTREYSLLHTQYFDDVVMMEVGALMVGKIVNHHQAATVTRGQEKGYFQFGGSTVVLLLKKGVAEIDPDIVENSQNDAETIVRYGEKIGISKK